MANETQPGTIENPTTPDPIDIEFELARLGESGPIGLEQLEKYREQQRVNSQLNELYENRGKYQNPEAIEALTKSKLTPFVNVKDGKVYIDIETALKVGVPETTIKQAGFRQLDISKAKRNLEIGRQQFKVNTLVTQINREKDIKRQTEKQAYSTLGDNLEFVKGLEIEQSKYNPKILEQTHVKLADGNYISKSDFMNRLSPKERIIARNEGYNGLTKYWQEEEKKYTLPEDAKELYDKSGPEDKFSILKAYNLVPYGSKYTGEVNGEPKWRTSKGIEDFVMSKNFSNLVVDSLVPFVYVIRNWNELSAAEKGINLAIDIATTAIPLVGAAARGAKGSYAVTRAGRLAGALKGLKGEMKLMTQAPFDLIAHPVGSMKGAARSAWDMLENIANYRKIPQAVLSTTYSTVRIPVKGALTEAQAIAVRDRLMSAIALTGGDVVMEFNGMKFTLSRSAFMKELGGGLAHTTPQGEAFLEGLKVKGKPGKPLSEQGLFMSHEPLERFARQSAYGGTGKMPTFFIVSPETAIDAIKTKKIYKSKFGKVAELEEKFPVNYKFKEPAQVLYTRIGSEKMKTVIMLEKPLSKTQVAKLKSLALIEDLKAPFKPALLMEDTGKYIKGIDKFDEFLDVNEVRRLARTLERTGNADVSRMLLRTFNATQDAREAGRKIQEKGRGDSRIGVGVVTIGGRTGGIEPERLMFTIHGERIGRIKSGDKTRAISGISPVRFVNSARASELGSTRTSKVVTTATTRTPTAEKKSETVPVRPRREDGGDSGDYERIRPTDKDTDETKRKVYKPRSQKESRKIIREAKIAVGWRQGQLHGKHRYDVITDPFTPAEEYLIIMGKRPQGVKLVRGPRSAYNSAQTLSGKLGKAGIVDIPGIMHVKMWPEGKKQIGLQFGRDANISNRKRVFPLSRKENEKA